MQGGHCPGNEGNQGKVRENEKGLKWSAKTQGIREKKRGKLESFDNLTKFYWLDDVSFCQTAISRSHRKLSEVREESGKMKIKKVASLLYESA